MSNLEERRVSFVSSKSNDQGKAPSRPESRSKGSLSGPGGKDKKGKGKKGSQSPKGSPKGSFARRGSRRASMKPKKVEDDAANKRARSDSLFKKSDVKYKEIRRALTKRQRDAKKQADSGEKPTQEL